MGDCYYSQIDTIFIGNSGQIVGSTFDSSDVDERVFLMKVGSAPTYQDTLRYPSKPNATDQFVATTKANGFALYETGKGAQDLIAMLPSSCSIKLQAPVAIADGGQIIANGSVGSANHGFLITP